MGGPVTLHDPLRSFVLASLRRLPLLAAILALSLVAGPAASALCAELAEGHEAHGSPAQDWPAHGEEHAPMEMPAEAPCHEAPAEKVPIPTENGADCDAPCCIGAADSTPLPVVPTVPALALAPQDGEPVVETEPLVDTRSVSEGRPPPNRLYLETGRVRM